MPLAPETETGIMAHFGGGFGGPSMYNENEDSEPEQALDDSLAMARVSESAKPSKSAASKKKDAPEQERRMLRPIAGVNHAPLKKGDEISYRQKRGKDVRKMRVLSPGLPWQEAMPGSGDVTQVRRERMFFVRQMCVDVCLQPRYVLSTPIPRI